MTATITTTAPATSESGLQARLRALWKQPPAAEAAAGSDLTATPAQAEAMANATPDAPIIAEPWDWFDQIDAEARDYLLGPRHWPKPCVWCGGRLRHNPACVALCDDWSPAMPFGKHKGRPVRSLGRDYLAWLLASGIELGAELRHEIERMLGPAKIV
ncbi:MAG: DUF3820 family protein [Pirellulales bacterium]